MFFSQYRFQALKIQALRMFLVIVFAGSLFGAPASPDNLDLVRERPEPPVRLHLIGGAREYKANESLALWRKRIEKNYHVLCTKSFAHDRAEHLPGIEKLKDADCLVIFCRRLEIKGKELDIIKSYITSGKPLIGIRTASHAFQNYLELDRKIFGGSYHGHRGSEEIRLTIPETAQPHPVLKGLAPWKRKGKLYRNEDNAKDTETLLMGEGGKQKQPVAWVRTLRRPGTKRKTVQRVFYSSMGVPADFRNGSFLRLLKNAVEWVTRRKLKPRRKS